MRAQQKEYALQRVVLPVSGIASWLLVLAGVSLSLPTHLRIYGLL